VLVAMEPAEFQPEGGRAKAVVSGPVLQNVRVLGMDLVADPSAVDKFVPKTATLEVSMEDAAKLAVAAELGTLSLALRRTGATEIEDAGPVRKLEWSRNGWTPTDAPPPRRPVAKRQRAAAPTQPKERTLTVVQGSERTTIQVPADRTGAWQ